jgi:hypothetical protein
MYFNTEKDCQNNFKNPGDALLVSVDQTVIRNLVDSENSFILDSLKFIFNESI